MIYIINYKLFCLLFLTSQKMRILIIQCDYLKPRRAAWLNCRITIQVDRALNRTWAPQSQDVNSVRLLRRLHDAEHPDI